MQIQICFFAIVSCLTGGEQLFACSFVFVAYFLTLFSSQQKNFQGWESHCSLNQHSFQGFRVKKPIVSYDPLTKYCYQIVTFHGDFHPIIGPWISTNDQHKQILSWIHSQTLTSPQKTWMLEILGFGNFSTEFNFRGVYNTQKWPQSYVHSCLLLLVGRICTPPHAIRTLGPIFVFSSP